MATSSLPMMAQQPPMTQLVAHASLKTAQSFSMLAPPAYLVLSFIRRGRGHPLSIRRLMSVSTSSVLVGSGIGAFMGWGRLRNEPEIALQDRIFRLAHNASQVRTDDYSIIGASLGIILAPALFLRRAPLVVLVLGGASIGLGAGVWAHLAQEMTEGQDVRPEGMVGELPVVGGNDKK
ncbi:hypothetical protein BCR39DRAFT_556213 [Naematelia encephala]|uniref:Uncharacterized protein n=1 Tax=Naematelia encephala TaxID=71784 RepID=A0A1Y2BIU3_9TREE|nr:hypothetical protein BCR39DRAFT_556213 [Naematelia encephala]